MHKYKIRGLCFSYCMSFCDAASLVLFIHGISGFPLKNRDKIKMYCYCSKTYYLMTQSNIKHIISYFCRKLWCLFFNYDMNSSITYSK